MKERVAGKIAVYAHASIRVHAYTHEMFLCRPIIASDHPPNRPPPTWDDVGHAAQNDNTKGRTHVLNKLHSLCGRVQEAIDGRKKGGRPRAKCGTERGGERGGEDSDQGGAGGWG
eukprot:evm.model.NODE_46223_length_22087_cov_47.868881.1